MEGRRCQQLDDQTIKELIEHSRTLQGAYIDCVQGLLGINREINRLKIKIEKQEKRIKELEDITNKS